eukprot:975182-Rhodomonas_salina.1
MPCTAQRSGPPPRSSFLLPPRLRLHLHLHWPSSLLSCAVHLHTLPSLSTAPDNPLARISFKLLALDLGLGQRWSLLGDMVLELRVSMVCTLRNQKQESAFLVQTVLKLRLFAFDSGVYADVGCLPVGQSRLSEKPEEGESCGGKREDARWGTGEKKNGFGRASLRKK